MSAFADRITILRPAMAAGRYNSNPQPDWTTPPARIQVPVPASVQPVSSDEGKAERPAVTSRWKLVGPPGHDVDLRSTDRVEVNGELVLSIVGDVDRWRVGTPGRVHHVEAILERVTG